MGTEQIDVLTKLESWYARDNGRHLLTTTRHALRDLLDTSFGYHLLQLGNSRCHPLFMESPINHRIYASECAGPGISLVTHPTELPLESDSIDSVIAHHCLDFAANPHQVLREIQRVLTPQGQLFIIGFNPYSLLGITNRLRGLSRHSLWHQHHPVSEKRLTDWLHLLGCEVQSSLRLYGIPPAGRGRLRQCLVRADNWCSRNNLPGGGVYVVHAIKQVSALHRPRRHFSLRRTGLIGLVPKPRPAPSPSPSTSAPVATRHRTVSGQGGPVS